MQARNQNISDFSARVEALAERCRVSLREVGPKCLGISTAQLFAYRSGSAPLSVKAWAKLESAESASVGAAETSVDAPTAVAEPRAPYGGESDLIEEIERHHAELLLAAHNDPVRLGWIREQQQAHLSVPSHWKGKRGGMVRVTLPSQTMALSTETGRPVANPLRAPRSA